MARPDLNVFVNTGDGDCCSIGAAHWIHAIRYNMNLTVILHDNHVYGLTKKQASPTSPIGTQEQHDAARQRARGAEPADRHARRAERLVRGAGRRLDAGDAVRHHLQGVPPPRLLVRAHHPALPRVAAEDVRAVAARSGQDAAADARERAAAERRDEPHLQEPARARPARTSTRRARSPRRSIRSRSASCTTTRACRATRTCAAPGAPRTAEAIRAGLDKEFDKFTIWPDEERATARRLTTTKLEVRPHGHGCKVPGPDGLSHDGQARGRRARGARPRASGPPCSRAYRDLTRLRYDYPVVLVERRRRPRLRAVAVVGRRRADRRTRAARHRGRAPAQAAAAPRARAPRAGRGWRHRNADRAVARSRGTRGGTRRRRARRADPRRGRAGDRRRSHRLQPRPGRALRHPRMEERQRGEGQGVPPARRPPDPQAVGHPARGVRALAGGPAAAGAEVRLRRSAPGHVRLLRDVETGHAQRAEGRASGDSGASASSGRSPCCAASPSIPVPRARERRASRSRSSSTTARPPSRRTAHGCRASSSW